MNVQKLVLGALQTNCYVVWDEQGAAAVIDPADNAEAILSFAWENGLMIQTLLLTHLHIDHFLAVPQLLAATDAALVIPKEEESALADSERSLQCWLRPEYRFTLYPHRLVGEGDTVEVGALRFLVWHTPGHTAGSSVYLCDDTLFTGDTLFEGSAGRTDLPSGDAAALQKSLQRLAAQEEDYKVYPGHGNSTTLRRECAANPFMK